MGLASSQARMLLLTARKSDLEYRAQMISQRKINLAMQSQQLATEYSRAMSNRKMEFVYYTDGNSGTTLRESLTYAGIMASNGEFVGDYIVKTANGKYVYTGNTEQEQLQSMYNVAKKLAEVDGKYNNYYTKDDNGNPKYDYESLIKAYSSKMTYLKEVNNEQVFQSALRNGDLYLEQAIKENGQVARYEDVAWSSLSCIQDNLDKTDDSAMEAEYEAKALMLTNQDKMLDLELNQIQSQHKAIETEYDSVKKVIEKNIDVSYKIFA